MCAINHTTSKINGFFHSSNPIKLQNTFVVIVFGIRIGNKPSYLNKKSHSLNAIEFNFFKMIFLVLFVAIFPRNFGKFAFKNYKKFVIAFITFKCDLQLPEGGGYKEAMQLSGLLIAMVENGVGHAVMNDEKLVEVMQPFSIFYI